MKFLFFFFNLLSTLVISGQNIALEFPIDLAKNNNGTYSQSIDLKPYIFNDFISFSLRVEEENLIPDSCKILLITSDSIYHLKNFEEELQSGRFVSNLIYLPKENPGLINFLFSFNDSTNTIKLKGVIRVFSPSITHTENRIIKKKNGGRDYSDCDCPLPEFVPRSSWGYSFGLNGNIYKPPAAYTEVTHMIIHHSAGTNTSSNWPGVVASIFDFHVNTNGWQDVGYNWLIDPNGAIYEGRGGGDNVRGAHMCGYNNNTLGVCILGTFTNVKPSQASFTALEKLLAWKSCQKKINPTGSNSIASYSGFMKNISGHRDGCSPNYTECPGNMLYAILDSIRNSTDTMINSECSPSIASEEQFNCKNYFYPNPVFNRFSLNNDCDQSPSYIELINSVGKVMIKESLENNMKYDFDMSFLNPGLYFLKLNFKTNIIITKMIKI
jgi:hypothetical protein